MQGIIRLICIICMILILIFAIIHLGVSIGIIARFHRYGDVFRPEIGLASFDIGIGIYAFLIGGFGLFSVLTNRGNLSKIVALATIVLALFTLVSLITALIINSLAINYVNSRFLNYMNNYENSQDSRNIIDKIQTNYDCCGSNTWLDWSDVLLNTTQSSTSSTTTLVITTEPVNGTNTTAVVIVNSTNFTTEVVVTTSTVISNEETFSNTTENSIIEKDVDSRSLKNMIETVDTNLPSREEITDNFNFERNPSQQIIRRKRQTQSDYGGIYGLPSSFIVTLPQSCCTTDLSTINSLSNSYCISNANSFHTDGCERQLGKYSVDQTVGLAVINSFLFVLALAAIALFIEANSDRNSPKNGFVNQPTQQYLQPSGGYSAAPYFPGMPYNSFNPTYTQYY